MTTFPPNQSTTTPDAWGHYPSRYIRYDLAAPNGVRVWIDERDQWLFLVPSKSNPGTLHIVSLVWGTLQGHCECKGFANRGKCRHLHLAYDAWEVLSREMWYIAKYTNPDASMDDQRYGAELLARITWTDAGAKKAVA